jgi:hypothetical protein
MIALQEELDWRCYQLYGLLEQAPVASVEQWGELPALELGQRAFEIALARKVEAGQVKTTWFTRHGSTPITTLPEHWPGWYKALVERRLALMASTKSIRLIERPEYKRRWNQDSWASREREALGDWLLARLESPRYFPQADREGPGAQEYPKLVTVGQLASEAAADPGFVALGGRYEGDPHFEVEALVRELVLANAVPYLPSQRYRRAGLDKRREWEAVWRMQRQEDAIDALAQLPPGHPDHLTEQEATRRKAEEVGEIPVPPKYKGAEFSKPQYYKLRGKLDVPREAFTLYPGCQVEGSSQVVSWAGLDHKQRAQALASWYVQGKEEADWGEATRLQLLAGLLDLIPWLEQWHPEEDEFIGQPLAAWLRDFVEAESRALNAGLDQIEAARLG